jgi:hypothetical protein
MIDISFEVNGKRLSPRNVGNTIERALLQSVQDEISRSVGSVRCPEHGQRPNIKARGRSIDSLRFEVSGCCDGLIKMVKRKLR